MSEPVVYPKADPTRSMTTGEGDAYRKGWQDCWQLMLSWVTCNSSPPQTRAGAPEPDLAAKVRAAAARAPEVMARLDLSDEQKAYAAHHAPSWASALPQHPAAPAPASAAGKSGNAVVCDECFGKGRVRLPYQNHLVIMCAKCGGTGNAL